MDLLATLNVPSLPEQQTRLSHHPNVARVLSSDSGRTVRLGFDACCTCARDLNVSPSTTGEEESKVEEKKETGKKRRRRKTSTTNAIECTSCRRVRYCSDECRRMDADPSLRPIGGDSSGRGVEVGESSAEGGGHGGVVCSLLRLCDEDEAVDDRFHDGGDAKTEKRTERSSSSSDAGGAAAAEDRVRSEYESYPATLANALLDAPCCRDVLRRCARGRRARTLTVHVVGASDGAELWRREGEGGGVGRIGLGEVRDAYAEALAEVVDSHRKLEGIDLVFVGPDCPSDATRLGKGWSKSKAGGALTSIRIVKRCNGGGSGGSGDGASSPSSSSCRVTFHLHRCDYEDCASGGTARGSRGRFQGREEVAATAPLPPDVVVLFNPGFTCPDYSWEDAVRALTPGAALLVTSNTEMEALLDCGFLSERGRVVGPIPPEVREMMGISPSSSPPPLAATTFVHGGEDESSASSSSFFFFGENPFAGSRVRQSGNMANDLFVKNGWMFGCVIGSGENTHGSRPETRNGDRRDGGATSLDDSSLTGKMGSEAEARRNDCEERGTSSKRRAKRHKVKGSGNSKRKNPALI